MLRQEQSLPQARTNSVEEGEAKIHRVETVLSHGEWLAFQDRCLNLNWGSVRNGLRRLVLNELARSQVASMKAIVQTKRDVYWMVGQVTQFSKVVATELLNLDGDFAKHDTQTVADFHGPMFMKFWTLYDKAGGKPELPYNLNDETVKRQFIMLVQETAGELRKSDRTSKEGIKLLARLPHFLRCLEAQNKIHELNELTLAVEVPPPPEEPTKSNVEEFAEENMPPTPKETTRLAYEPKRKKEKEQPAAESQEAFSDSFAPVTEEEWTEG
jgi:hypothetical protein